ncbi:MAG: hypothetical protein K2Y37_19690 [Pirellulales bacterium]|nr:hypothetical protein [Pirellulales bacterium]
MQRFFQQLYEQYDMRFVYAAPPLQSVTRRVAWSLDEFSTEATTILQNLDYLPRLAAE